MKNRIYEIQSEDDKKERAVLVGLAPAGPVTDGADTLDELASLAETAGAEVVGRIVQRHRKVNSSTFIGKGKLEELKEACERAGADVVIFDDELTPGQLRNLEKASGVRIIDRTELVLDILKFNN